MRFCPKCSYFLYLDAPDGKSQVNYQCRNCGYVEPLNPKTTEEALILETSFRTGSAAAGAASGITINAYTLMDPTLPHIKSLRCPNATCPSRSDESKRDVIYIKTDPTNLKFQYICTVEGCHQQWTS
jgi:DNA-directed RNA polymerase subunit M/transcription elongation factor TFIIS